MTAVEAPLEIDAPATLTVAASLAAIFVLQLLFGGFDRYGGFNLSHEGMLRLGALTHGRVFGDGEWWRLFTAPVLHGGFIHILFNGIWLVLAGRFVERYLGGWTVIGLLVICGLAGALLSAATLDGLTYSVGASGAIVGLGAAGVVLASMGERADDFGTGHKGRLAQLVVLSLIPASGGVDYATHFGGAIAGGVCGLILLGWDAPAASAPWRRRLGQALGFAYLAVLVFAVARIIQG